MNPIQNGLTRRTRKSAAQQVDIVTIFYNPSENLMQMQLRAASVGVVAILPVDDKDAQGSEHALLTRVRIEHSVHKARALLASITLCKSHGFLDHNARRSGALQQLGDCKSQH
jgi:hypothetical protein